MVGGLLLLLGLFTHLVAVALMVDKLAAIATTKSLILRKDGVWKMAYETRTDWPMLIGALLLPLVGAGT
jgi:uncharacterized membrane protein YphA (DoxX/SURF4 family)